MRAGHVDVAMKLDVAAERDGGEAPSGPLAVDEACHLGTEAQGEHVDLNPAPSPDQKVTEFVEEHHDGEHEQEGHEIAEHRADMGKQHRELPRTLRVPLRSGRRRSVADPEETAVTVSDIAEWLAMRLHSHFEVSKPRARPPFLSQHGQRRWPRRSCRGSWRTPLSSPASQVRSTKTHDVGKADASGDEGLDRDFVRRVEHRGKTLALA